MDEKSLGELKSELIFALKKGLVFEECRVVVETKRIKNTKERLARQMDYEGSDKNPEQINIFVTDLVRAQDRLASAKLTIKKLKEDLEREEVEERNELAKKIYVMRGINLHD